MIKEILHETTTLFLIELISNLEKSIYGLSKNSLSNNREEFVFLHNILIDAHEATKIILKNYFDDAYLVKVDLESKNG